MLRMPEQSTGSVAVGTHRDERRVSLYLLSHWHASRHDHEMPSLSELKFGENSELFDCCFVLRGDLNPYLSVFIHCGASQQSAYEENPVGKTLVDCVPTAILDRICVACFRSLRERAPVEDAGDYVEADGTKVKYRAIFMPTLLTIDSGNWGGCRA